MRKLVPASVFVALLALSAAVGAQSASVPSALAGTWRRTVSTQRARSIVLAAFQPRLANFPGFLQSIGRDRISESLPMPHRVQVAIEGERVHVTYVGESRVSIATPLGGSTRVRDADGETRRVTQRLRGGWLEQVYTGDDGSVHRLLSTEPDGSTMHLDFTAHNERLGEPVRWRIDYRR